MKVCCLELGVFDVILQEDCEARGWAGHIGESSELRADDRKTLGRGVKILLLTHPFLLLFPSRASAHPPDL